MDSECKIKFKGKICRVHRVHVPSTSPWFPCFSCPLLPVTVHYQAAPPGVALLLPPGLGVEGGCDVVSEGLVVSRRSWTAGGVMGSSPARLSVCLLVYPPCHRRCVGANCPSCTTYYPGMQYALFPSVCLTLTPSPPSPPVSDVTLSAPSLHPIVRVHNLSYDIPIMGHLVISSYRGRGCQLYTKYMIGPATYIRAMLTFVDTFLG